MKITSLAKTEYKNTSLLFARFFFNDLSVKDLVKWAKGLVNQGYYSKSLTKIVRRQGTKEKTFHKYFINALRELNYPIGENNKKENSCHYYSEYITRLYFENSIDATLAIRKYLEILKVTDDKEKYLGFFHLAEEFDLIAFSLGENALGGKKNKLIKKKFSKVHLQFLEKNSSTNYRKRLERKSDKKLIEIKYFRKSKYERLILEIVDDIIEKRGLTKKEINKIKIKLSKNWRILNW